MPTFSGEIIGCDIQNEIKIKSFTKLWNQISQLGIKSCLHNKYYTAYLVQSRFVNRLITRIFIFNDLLIKLAKKEFKNFQIK